MDIRKMVSEIKEKMDRAGGLKHVYFVACGGSKAAIFPGLYLLQSEAKGFGASTYTSNEFVHVKPKELDNRCIAVICSLKATPETVEAVRMANGKGAVTIAMTGSMETGMAKVARTDQDCNLMCCQRSNCTGNQRCILRSLILMKL